MGIINITPDSFSGDGLLLCENFAERATAQAIQMVADGANILDVGGESTRPGAQTVTLDEEIRRTAPVLTALRTKMPHIPLSIDTTKPEVARAALEAGATLLNDVSGVAQDPAMRHLAAKHGAYLIQMHNTAQTDAVAHTQTIGGEYLADGTDDIIAHVAQALAGLAAIALEDGVAPQKIILDPGIGFGKTLEQNLQLINHLDDFIPLGFPLLLGASRKSFIGRALDLPSDERLEGTAAVTAVAAMRCPAILRVHDVKFMARVAKMAWALRVA